MKPPFDDKPHDQETVHRMLEQSNLSDNVFSEMEIRKLFPQAPPLSYSLSSSQEQPNPNHRLEVIVQESKDKYFWDKQPPAVG